MWPTEWITSSLPLSLSLNKILKFGTALVGLAPISSKQQFILKWILRALKSTFEVLCLGYLTSSPRKPIFILQPSVCSLQILLIPLETYRLLLELPFSSSMLPLFLRNKIVFQITQSFAQLPANAVWQQDAYFKLELFEREKWAQKYFISEVIFLVVYIKKKILAMNTLNKFLWRYFLM